MRHRFRYSIIFVIALGIFALSIHDLRTDNKSQIQPEGNVAIVVDAAATADPYAQFSWKDASGNIASLRDHKGKVVLINFWATWCVPCRKEIPELIEINDEIDGQQFFMIGVSVDTGNDSVAKVNRFIDQQKIDYLNILDDGRLVNKFGSIRAVPTTILLNKEGKVAEVIVGVRSKAEFTEKIRALL